MKIIIIIIPQKVTMSKYNKTPEEIVERVRIASKFVYEMTALLIWSPDPNNMGLCNFEEFYRNVYNLTLYTKKDNCPIKELLSESIHEGATKLLIKHTGTPEECRKQFDDRIASLQDCVRYWMYSRKNEDAINEFAEASWERALGEVRSDRHAAFMEAGFSEDLTWKITNMSLPAP